MALPTFSEFKNGSGNIGSSKLPSFSEFQKTSPITQKRNEVQAERADRISKGEAVSVNKNKAAPTFGGKIVRGIVKPAATLIARPAQAVAAARGFTEDEQTFKSKYLGDIKTSKNAKDVVKDVGRGLETVSNAIGVGALKTAGANVARQGVLQVAKRAGVEGLAAGAVQGIGSGVADGKTGKDLLWSAAKSTALGGAGGFVLGGALSKIMGTPKSLDEIAKAKAPYKIPKAGVAPSPTIETPVELKLAENVPTNVGTKGSIPTVSTEIPTLPPDKTITPKGTVVPKVTVGAPVAKPTEDALVTEARKYKNSEEFISGLKNEVKPIRGQNGILDVAKTEASLPPIKEGYERFYRGESPTIKHSDVWNEAEMRIPDGAKSGDSFWLTPELNYADYYRETYGSDAKINYIDLPKGLAKTDPRYEGEFFVNKSELTDIYNKAVLVEEPIKVPKVVKEKQVKVLSTIPDENLSFKNKEAQIDFYNTDKDRAFRIVTGKEAVPEGINPKALYRLLSNEASDGDMINKLANSKLPYEAGADLSMLNIGDRTNSVVDVVREANTTLRKTLDPKAAKKAIAELAEEIRVNKPTLEEIKKLIDEFDIC